MTDWADELTDKLLKEEPEDKPFRAIMASALRAERERCANIVRTFGHTAEVRETEWLACKVEDYDL